MKRRTVLKRFAAGGVSTVALAGTTTAASNSELEDLRGTDYMYRVTDAGLEKVRVGESFDSHDECTTDRCCVCPDECKPECWCLTPC